MQQQSIKFRLNLFAETSFFKTWKTIQSLFYIVSQKTSKKQTK